MKRYKAKIEEREVWLPGVRLIYLVPPVQYRGSWELELILGLNSK